MKNKKLTKFTLLIASTMTIMAGTVVAPSLPQIKQVFETVPNADILIKLILTLPALFIALFAPFAGYIIDKFGRKKLLLYSLLLYGIAGTTGFYLHSLLLILIGRAFLGIGIAGIMTTVTTLIADYFEGDERNAFVGYQGSFIAFGGVLFLVFGGIFADINWHMPFLIYGFSFLVFFFGINYLFEPNLTHKSYEYFFDLDNSDYSKRTVTIILAIAFILTVFFFMMPVQIPFMLSKQGEIKTSLIGLVISSSTLTGAVTSLNYKTIRKYLNFKQIYAMIFCLMGIGYLIISLSDSLLIIIFGLIVGGAGVGLVMPNSSLWLISIAPVSLRGRIMGNLTTAMFLGQFSSPLLIQPLIKFFSLQKTFAIIGLFMVTFAIIMISRDFVLKNRLKLGKII